MELSGIPSEPSHYQGSHMQKISHIGGDRAGSVFRLYMGGNALVSWYNATNEPRSLSSLAASSPAGLMMIWLLAVIGIAAVVDAIVNDFLPQRFHWHLAVRQRHFILAGMAFCYVAQLYTEFFTLRSTGLLLSYGWNASIIMFIAFVDAHQRSKDATCVISCN